MNKNFVKIIEKNKNKIYEALEEQFKQSCRSNNNICFSVAIFADESLQKIEEYSNTTIEFEEKNIIIHSFEGFNCLKNIDIPKNFLEENKKPNNWDYMEYEEKINFIGDDYINDLIDCIIDDLTYEIDFDKIIEDKIKEISKDNI